MKTRCRRCRKLIEFRTTYCNDCKSIVIKSSKQGLKNKEVDSLLKTSKWQSMRAKIIRRDKCCIPCFLKGIIEYRRLQVHHIYKRIDREELIFEELNLITVCRVCHEEMELLPPKTQLDLLKSYFNSLQEENYLL